jgi:cytoskeletal protein RodZ
LAIVIVILVLLVVGGALWWFVLRPRTGAPSQESSQQVTTTATGATDAQAANGDSESSQGADIEALKPNARLKAMLDAGEVRSIRLIGDSITEGVGTDGHADPYVENTGVVIYDDGQGDVHYEATTEADDTSLAPRARLM